MCVLPFYSVCAHIWASLLTCACSPTFSLSQIVSKSSHWLRKLVARIALAPEHYRAGHMAVQFNAIDDQAEDRSAEATTQGPKEDELRTVERMAAVQQPCASQAAIKDIPLSQYLKNCCFRFLHTLLTGQQSTRAIVAID